MKLQHYIALLFGLLSTLVCSQNITFKSEASTDQVRVGEQFKVGFYLISDSRSISVDSPINFPNFAGFHVLGENSVRNFQVINGEMQSSSGVELVLVAEREGRYKIGSAKVVIDGKTYATKPIDIVVNERPQTAYNAQPNRTQSAFLSSEVSKKDPYVNEAVNLSVKLYARDYSLLNRAKNFKAANFSGLDAKVINQDDQAVRMKQEMVNGRVYISEEIVRYLLFPQDAGNIKIEPFTLDLMVSGFYGAEPVTISSNPVYLNVKKLPAGKPKNFSGAVGDFTMKTQLSKDKLNQNETTNFTVEINGTGNLNQFALPNLKGNENLEIYPPKKQEKFEATAQGYTGKITERHMLIPQYGGEYHLDPIEFSYFNPKSGKYVTLKSEPIQLQVKGDLAPEKVDSTAKVGEVNDYLANSGNENQLLPKITEKLPEKVKDEFFSVGFLGLIGIALAVLFGFLMLKNNKKKKKNKSVTAVNQPEQAPKKVVKKQKWSYQEALQTLRNHLNADDKNFFAQLEKILIDLARHYTDLDLANFTDFRAAELMKANGIDVKLVDEWQTLLNKAQQAKYAPSTEFVDQNALYLQTENLLKRF
ncbi:BatD family protein [Vaginella massiliensis]|uniref:BatD family protein n=1 Tax=Vaginella massiliensis TaxID=1816680 RepID=UPI0008390E2E|nr:BatD family protein [Vaginella massiliensis]